MIFGPDVSDFQEGVDWSAVRSSGRLFGFAKATEGRTFVASTLDTNRRGMAAAGLILRGLYHFARPDRNAAAAEADHFLSTVGQLAAGEVAVLDLETGNIGHAETGAWALEWLERVERTTGRTPWVYSYGPFLADFDTSRLTRFPLWIAGYGPNNGKVPADRFRPDTDRWPRATVWQYTSAATVPGVSGQCDDNLFEGSEADLQALAGGTTPEAAVTHIRQESLLDAAHPELARRFRAGAARFGGDVDVNSVLRDTELQRQFSDCYQTKLRTGKCPPGCERSGCAPANAAGTSNHEPHGAIQKSLAIDAEPVNGDWSGFHSAMKAEGLVNNISGEDWHLQCKETPLPYYEVGSEDRLPIAPAPSEEDQLFSTSPVATFHLIASHSGLLLTSSAAEHQAGVIQRRSDGSLNQRWELWGHDDGTVSFLNRAGGFALDRPDYNTDAGTLLQVANSEFNDAQRWTLDKIGSIARIWVPGTNRCLDVRGRSMDEGAGLQLWYGLRDEDDPRHQQFLLAPTI